MCFTIAFLFIYLFVYFTYFFYLIHDYLLQVFKQCLLFIFKERLPNVDIRPDKDKIGPLFETRNDNIIGHLIILLQYNWPKGDVLFEQLVKMITTLGGLKYRQFFSYVISIFFYEDNFSL